MWPHSFKFKTLDPHAAYLEDSLPSSQSTRLLIHPSLSGPWDPFQWASPQVKGRVGRVVGTGILFLAAPQLEVRGRFSRGQNRLRSVSSRQCLLRAQEGVRLGSHCGQCHHTRGSPARRLSQFLLLCLGPHLTHSHLPHGVPRAPGHLSQSVPHARMPSTDTSIILIYQPKHLHSSRVVERNDQGENAQHSIWCWKYLINSLELKNEWMKQKDIYIFNIDDSCYFSKESDGGIPWFIWFTQCLLDCQSDWTTRKYQYLMGFNPDKMQFHVLQPNRISARSPWCTFGSK